MTDMKRTESQTLRLNESAGTGAHGIQIPGASRLNPASILMLCSLLALIPACGGGGFSPDAPPAPGVSAISLGNGGAGAPVANVNTATNQTFVQIQFTVTGVAGSMITIVPKYYVDADASNSLNGMEVSLAMTEAPMSAVDNVLIFPSTAGSQTIPQDGSFEGVFYWDAMTDLGGLGAKYGVQVCVTVDGSMDVFMPAESASPTQSFASSSSSSQITGSITSPTSALGNSGRTRHTADLVSSLNGTASMTDMGSEVLVVGGVDSAGAQLDSLDRFSLDVTSSTIAGANGGTATGANVREQHSSATYLDTSNGNNVRVLVTGGSIAGTATASADVYAFGPMGADSVTMTSMTMAFPRRGHASCWLPNNTILITGGLDATNAPVTSAEIFDPSNMGSPFSTVAGPGTDLGRTGHTQTLLPDGTVLIAGGVDGGGNALAAYIFNPNGNSFTTAPGGSSVNRQRHTATLMVNGVVALTGGVDSTGATVLNTVDFYRPFSVVDAATSVTIPAGFTSPNKRNGPVVISPAVPVNATSARTNHSASRLGDGRLLVVGGLSSPTQSLNTAEFFVPFGINDNAIGSFTLANPAMAGSMNIVQARADHTQTTMQDGSIAIVGGQDVGVTNASDSIEVFRFSNSRPTVSNVTVAGAAGGDLTVSFDLADAENDRSFVIARYSINGGAFMFATLMDYRNTVNLAPGTKTLTWNSVADLVTAGDSVVFEIIPVGGSLGNPVSSAATTIN